MDDPNQENIDSSWVVINTIDIAEEATILNCNVEEKEIDKEDKNHDVVESDVESDGISIISESSHLHESNNEDENFVSNAYERNDDEDDVLQKQFISDQISPEDASQQKGNWTFVGTEPVSPEMTSSNQFYLNCLQEPVQELSEHELGSVQSDLESDGVSIISECESLTDFTDDEKQLSEENCDNERLGIASKLPLPPGIKKYCNGVLIGTILLATTSIFLGQYFNSVEHVEELPIYKEEYMNELTENAADQVNEKYEVPTALAYCIEHFMGKKHNIDHCLKRIKYHMRAKNGNAINKEEMNELEKYLKIKEQFLEEKEQFLIKREYELLKAESKLKQDDSCENKNSKVHLDELNESSDETLNDFSKIKVGKESKINKHLKHKDQRHKHNKDKIKYDKSKNVRNNKKDKNINTHKNIVYSWKHKTFSSHNLNKNGRHKSSIKNKEEKFTNNEQTIMTENSNKNKKRMDNLYFGSREDRKADKLKKKKMKSSTNYIILENNDNQTANGYWVGRLYKGRNDIRNKKHGGDWYFDRASYRKTKRDKAKWYFDWMMDREMLRYKRSFHI